MRRRRRHSRVGVCAAVSGIGFTRRLQTRFELRVTRRLRHVRLHALVLLLVARVTSFAGVVTIDGDGCFALFACRAACVCGFVQRFLIGPRGLLTCVQRVIARSERIFAAVGRIAARVVLAMTVVQRARERIVRSGDGGRSAGAWRNARTGRSAGTWRGAAARRLVYSLLLIGFRAACECTEHRDCAGSLSEIACACGLASRVTSPARSHA